MCPRADVPICLVGMHPFVGLCGVVTLDDHVVLLSKAPEMERSRTDLWRYEYCIICMFVVES